MDTTTAPLSRLSRYYTVMCNLPEEFNRERLQSLLNSICDVASLTLLKVQRAGHSAQRIGLVEVTNNESVFRLTSRQFHVGKELPIVHKLISENSKLVQHCMRQPDVPMVLKFRSLEKAACSEVLDYFTSIGSLKLQSMRSQAGQHEIHLKVGKTFSLRWISTTLHVKVGPIEVEVVYPEDTLSQEFFQQDLAFLKEFEKIHHSSPGQITENYKFFKPWMSRRHDHDEDSKPVELKRLPNPGCGLDQEIEDPDALSEMSLESEEESDWENAQPTKSINGLDFFSQTNSKQAIQRFSSKITIAGTSLISKHQEDHETAFIDDSASRTQAGTHSPTSAASSSKNTEAPSKTVSSKKKPSKNNKKGKKATEKEVQSACRAEPSASSDTIIKSPEQSEGDKVNKSPAMPSGDGSTLLSLIWTAPRDFEALNAQVMPEIHSKWRRFVEIKDEMRKERYQEYLQHKKKEDGSLAGVESKEVNNDALESNLDA